jgi:DNA-directed RNA polymerase alpha subunit
MSEVDPTPELPDDTPLADVKVVSGIRNVLTAAGMKTVGEMREAPDRSLLSLPALGKGSLTYLRQQLGLPSSDGVRLLPRKPS